VMAGSTSISSSDVMTGSAHSGPLRTRSSCIYIVLYNGFTWYSSVGQGVERLGCRPKPGLYIERAGISGRNSVLPRVSDAVRLMDDAARNEASSSTLCASCGARARWYDAPSAPCPSWCAKCRRDFGGAKLWSRRRSPGACGLDIDRSRDGSGEHLDLPCHRVSINLSVVNKNTVCEKRW
jgi:hypothetical protein